MPPRRPGPPPPGARPAGSPPQGFRQPPPGRRPPPPPPEREPELITHHAHNGTDDDFGYDDRYDDDETRLNEFAAEGEPEDEYDENGKKIKPPLTPKQRKKRRWKIIRRVLYAMFGLFVVVPAIAFVITYFLVDVPDPNSVAALQSQPVTFYYANGQEMGKVTPPTGARQLLQVGQVPPVVKHAAMAAEDATFETNSGFDVIGILRAVFNQATGGQGGGSTISQQYIKKATENDAPTLTRKWTELAKSFKMNNQQSKEQIITSYLNIVYFGRGAYGIQAASKAYFNKDASQLSPSESALLAGLIQGPGKSEQTAYVQKRWRYVIDQMQTHGWISKADHDAATFPTPIPKDSLQQQNAGTLDGLIKKRVFDELDAAGHPQNELFSSGAKIYTTIDPQAQQMAVAAVTDNLKKMTDDRILGALVAIDPKTGGVIAYYGGPDKLANGNPASDRANQARNPGSSIKPYDATAFLKLGKGLGETFDGTSPRTFPGVAKPVRNAGEADSCSKECTVKYAMQLSTNTVFYDMVLNVVKPARVAQAAVDAGVRTKAKGGMATLETDDNNISLGGGGTQVTPEDQAAGYATFASGGIYHQQHFVAKLTNSQDEVIFDKTQPDPGKPAFDPDADKSKQIAGNITDALGPVIPFSHLTCPSGHECAGKTGTQQYDPQDGDPKSYANLDAQTWMVGYTNSVSTAVWVGGDGNKPLHNNSGGPLFGKDVAGPAWQQFMKNYLASKPPEKFEKVPPIGKDPDAVTATPTPTPTGDTPTPTPTGDTPPPSTTPTETDTNTDPNTPTKPGHSGRPGPTGPTLGNNIGGNAAPPGAPPG